MNFFAAARNRTIYPIMPQPMKNGLKLPHDPEYSIERYKQPVRLGEHSRFLLVGENGNASNLLRNKKTLNLS